MGTGYMNPVHTAPSVGTTSTEILAAAEVERVKYRLFQNVSDTDIWLSLGEIAETDKGILLAKAGGTFEMSREKGNLFVGACYAIHKGTGDKTVCVTEGA